MKNANKDWQTITDFRRHQIWLSEMTYEVCHIPTGKTRIFKTVQPPNSAGEFCAYDMFVKAPNRDDFENRQQYWDVYVEYVKQNCKPVTEFKVRYNPKKIEKLEKIIDIIQVGDYVNFGSSRRYKWRKVLNLEFDYSFTAFSQYSKTPNDEGLVLNASVNSLLTTKEIYRDGKKIF